MQGVAVVMPAAPCFFAITPHRLEPSARPETSKTCVFFGVVYLSSGWTSLFDPSILAAIWALALAIGGGPLLWRFLNYRPVTRNAVLNAAWNFVATGCWFTFGNGAINAHERGMISLPMSILAVALLFVVAAGGSLLMQRWCPDTQT